MAQLKSKRVLRDNPTFDDVRDWYNEHLHPDKLDIEDEEVYKHVYDEGRFPAIFQFSSCLIGSSLVTMHDMKKKRIDEIAPGDVVKVYDQQTKLFVNSYVSDSSSNGVKECIQIEFENGKSLTCTKDHMILTHNKGWVHAISLTYDDDIVEYCDSNNDIY